MAKQTRWLEIDRRGGAWYLWDMRGNDGAPWRGSLLGTYRTVEDARAALGQLSLDSADRYAAGQDHRLAREAAGLEKGPDPFVE